MNPSGSGWLEKFGHTVKDLPDMYSDFQALYIDLKKTGFVYGINTKVPRFVQPEHELSIDEKAKINLITALYFTYVLETGNSEFKLFLDTIFNFYKLLDVGQRSLLNKFLTGKKTTSQLEKLINSRVFLDDNLISKTFNSIITNSLLYIDVLTFKNHLQGGKQTRHYAQELEFLAMNVTYNALHSKVGNKKDKKLAQLFKASLTYLDVDKQKNNLDGTYRDTLLKGLPVWENHYFLDMACMAVWEDKTLEYQESEFIYGIGKDMGFNNKEITTALAEMHTFFDRNSAQIPYLKDSNLAVQFYDSMSKVVVKLILRNSKRLQKELAESKELMYLLSKSTVKDLSSEEKKKVKNQLLDIFKSIPSLAIFLLPGGALLLPIFIKLIPKLLPSSFDDNRVEK